MSILVQEDLDYIRRRAVENGEEYVSRYNSLHTVHFDGIKDLARDRGNTKIMTSRGFKYLWLTVVIERS